MRFRVDAHRRHGGHPSGRPGRVARPSSTGPRPSPACPRPRASSGLSSGQRARAPRASIRARSTASPARRRAPRLRPGRPSRCEAAGAREEARTRAEGRAPEPIGSESSPARCAPRLRDARIRAVHDPRAWRAGKTPASRAAAAPAVVGPPAAAAPPAPQASDAETLEHRLVAAPSGSHLDLELEEHGVPEQRLDLGRARVPVSLIIVPARPTTICFWDAVST